MGTDHEDRRARVALAICAAAYLYVFPYQPLVGNPNEDIRLYTTAAIVEQHTYRVDAIRARWGAAPDNDAATRDGHVYSPKAPGTSLLGVPGYALYYAAIRALGRTPDHTVALWVVRVTASVLPTLLWLFAFHRWLRAFSDRAVLRDAVFFSVALGSPVYGYGMLFTSHAQSAGAAFGAFAILRSARAARSIRGRDAFVAGLLTAGVTLFEYPGLVASTVLCAYGAACVRPSRRLACFAFGALLPVLAMMHFQWCAFGSAFTPGHRLSINPEYRAALHQGMFGATRLSPSAAAALLLDPGFGLFALTPVLLFAPLGLARAWRRGDRLDVAVLFTTCLGTTAAIASMNNWRGGWTVGARYLCALIPLLAWAALDGLDGLYRRMPRATCSMAIGATAAALVTTGTVSAYYPYVPPEITRPLPQLVAVLVRGNHAPYNLAGVFGVFGTLSMLPLAALGAAVLARLTRDAPPRERAARIAGACVVAALCLGPALTPSSGGPSAAPAVAFVTRTWMPPAGARPVASQRPVPPPPVTRAWPFR